MYRQYIYNKVDGGIFAMDKIELLVQSRRIKLTGRLLEALILASKTVYWVYSEHPCEYILYIKIVDTSYEYATRKDYKRASWLCFKASCCDITLIIVLGYLYLYWRLPSSLYIYVYIYICNTTSGQSSSLQEFSWEYKEYKEC